MQHYKLLPAGCVCVRDDEAMKRQSLQGNQAIYKIAHFWVLEKNKKKFCLSVDIDSFQYYTMILQRIRIKVEDYSSS